MTTHTKGLLATFEVGDNGNLALGSEDKTSLLTIVDEDGIDFAALYHAADAKRLAACWNLLDGYDTKAFEGMTLAEFVAKQAYLSEMTTVDGMSITLSGLAMQMVAASFAGQFKANGASNYLEISASHPDTGPFTITMQRKEGVTPIMRLEAMTKQRDAAYVMAGKSGLERDKFAQQLKAANRQISLMAELLRDSCDINKALGYPIDLRENDGKEDALSILSEHLDKCESLLSSELPDHVAGAGKMVPEGWKLVPVKPTEEMITAALRNQKIKYAARATYAGVYSAMLSAAPKPQGGAPCDTGLPSSKSD